MEKKRTSSSGMRTHRLSSDSFKGRPKFCSSNAFRNSGPTGSPSSSATIFIPALKAWPARMPRERRSRASGKCSSNLYRRFDRLCLSTINGRPHPMMKPTMTVGRAAAAAGRGCSRSSARNSAAPPAGRDPVVPPCPKPGRSTYAPVLRPSDRRGPTPPRTRGCRCASPPSRAGATTSAAAKVGHRRPGTAERRPRPSPSPAPGRARTSPSRTASTRRASTRSRGGWPAARPVGRPRPRGARRTGGGPPSSVRIAWASKWPSTRRTRDRSRIARSAKVCHRRAVVPRPGRGSGSMSADDGARHPMRSAAPSGIVAVTSGRSGAGSQGAGDPGPEDACRASTRPFGGRDIAGRAVVAWGCGVD